MAKSRDLFDDSTMSFGEHLEVLRLHLWKALLGTTVCVIFALFIGNNVVDIVRGPIDRAMAQYGQTANVEDNIGGFDLWKNVKALFDEDAKRELEEAQAKKNAIDEEERQAREEAAFVLEFKASDLLKLLHEADPKQFPEPQPAADKTVALSVTSSELGKMAGTVHEVEEVQRRPVTLQVQEAFMTYLKVSLITGFVLSSPWIFYQLWLFVAAGLYPHERRYIHYYLPCSIGLFIGGALFCFYAVFPFVLTFLLGYNARLHIQPQIRLSEWVSFALMMPVMFGISFQLPLVMLFLDRINVFSAQSYRDKRRFAILVIAFLAMILTPADPASMLLMLIPMLALYELGIVLCGIRIEKSPYHIEAEG